MQSWLTEVCIYLRYVTRSIVLFTGNVVPSAQWPSSLIGRKCVRAEVNRSSSGSGALIIFCCTQDSLPMVTGLLHGTTGKKQLPVRGLQPSVARLPRPPQHQGPSPVESAQLRIKVVVNKFRRKSSLNSIHYISILL